MRACPSSKSTLLWAPDARSVNQQSFPEVHLMNAAYKRRHARYACLVDIVIICHPL